MGCAFTIDVRVLTCESCGAPLVMQSTAAVEPCNYCGTQATPHVSQRGVPRAPSLPDAQRLGLLQQQAGNVPGPPASVTHLMPGGELVPWKASEAISRWSSARRALPAGAQPEHEAEVRWLALALADHYAETNDAMRERAVLETSGEALSHPTHRQVVFCALAQSACRTGDLPAAEAWLALCDPCPHELEADGAFRVTRALLATAARRYDVVNATLAEEIPVSPAWEPSVALLRANAWEQHGDVQTALTTLDAFVSQKGGVMRHRARRLRARYEALGLCRQSWPLVDKQQRERGVKLAGRAIVFPWVHLAVILFFGLLVGVVLVLPLTRSAAALIAYLVGFPPVIVALPGVFRMRKWRHARTLRARGEAALAQVLHVTLTGAGSAFQSQRCYWLLVLPVAATPFETYSVFNPDERQRALLMPGAVTTVRYDPNDTSLSMIELD